jgi:hypothetical protein
MKSEQYAKAGEKELEKPNFYKEVENDPSEEIKKKSDAIVQDMFVKDEITESVAKFLIGGQKNLSTYYHLLKTHKIPQDVDNPTEWLENQGYPIRGIISARGGPTERLAGFVDFFLQPGMKALPSFLQDTKHTIQILEEINQKIDEKKFSLEGIALVTLDVESMYNFMTDELAGGACKDFLEKRTVGNPEIMKVKSASILKALDLCLKSNFFEFNDKIYQQTGGVGTGIKLAPPYVCLGMGRYESKAFNSDFHLLDRILLWKRFIDDVLMLFRGSKEECDELVDWLNSLCPGVVKFKYQYSTEMVEFLDLQIFVENGRLETNLFIKPSNLQLYLDKP